LGLRRRISSLLAVEHHGLDLPFWKDLVTGIDDGYMAEGYVRVSNKPGLGIDVNEEIVEAHLMTPGMMFLPTDGWNTPKLDSWKPGRGNW
jgi:L-alanine-DL-glutamate epimerase-like enolase superfamily enzyme